MLRAILVTFCFGAGAIWGLTSILGAGCMLVWNDIFRPTAWARYHGWLARHNFPSHDFCYAILLFAIFFTRWKKRWCGITTILCVMLAWVWISTFKAVHYDLALDKAIETTKYIVPLIIMSMALTERRHQVVFVYMLAASVGVWMAHHGWITLLSNQPLVRMHIPAGQMTDRNDFLVAGTGCLPLLVYMAWHYEGRAQRWIRLATKFAVITSVVAFFTSLSRGAMVGLAGLTCFYAVGTGRVGRRVVIAGILGFMAISLIPDFVWARLETIELGPEQTEASARNRIGHMITATEVTLDYPVFGVGARNYPIIASTYGDSNAEPHSIWLKCSAEHGITMLVFFVAVVATQIGALRRVIARARARKDKKTEALATALCCAIAGFLASGTFTSQFLSEYLWAILTVTGAFIATERARLRELGEDRFAPQPRGAASLASAAANP